MIPVSLGSPPTGTKVSQWVVQAFRRIEIASRQYMAPIARTDDTNVFTGFPQIIETTGSGQASAGLIIENDDDSATSAGHIQFYRNSNSPAANDNIARISWFGNDTIGQMTEYSAIWGRIKDPTDGSEDGSIIFATTIAGVAPAAQWELAAGFFYFGGADPGAGKINVQGIQIAGVDIFARNNVWTGTNAWSYTGSANYSFYGTTGSAIAIDSPAGFNRNIAFNSAGVGRWNIRTDNSAEGPLGSNAGSNLLIIARDDSNGIVTTPFSITRATGYVQFNTVGASTISYRTTQTDDGVIGTIWDSFHISASPAASDVTHTINAYARSSTAVARGYGVIQHQILDPTNTSEDSRWLFYTMVAGTLSSRLAIGGGIYYPGLTDPGAGNINFNGIQIGGVDITTGVSSSLLAANNTWTGANTWTQNMNLAKVQPAFVMRDPTASPVVDTVTGWLQGVGLNSTGGSIDYASIMFRISDPTAGSEDGYYIFRSMTAGAFTDSMTLRSGLYMQGATSGDPGVGKINAQGYSVNGTDLFARNNTWTGSNVWTQNMLLQKAGPSISIDGVAGGGQVSLLLNGAAATSRIIYALTGGSTRWSMNFANTAAESGSNAGSDFNLSAYTDAGALVATVMTITRATGAMGFTSLSTGTDWNFVNTDAGAQGATIAVRKNSASPAAGDIVTYFSFQGNNSGGTNRGYVVLYAQVDDITAASEDSHFVIQTYVAGALQGRVSIGGGIFYYGGADPGIGGANFQNLLISGTNIFARANTWTADQTISKATPALTVSSTSGNSNLTISGPAATYRLLYFATAGTARFRITVNNAAEAGSNAGSDLDISTYTDAGAFGVVALSIDRSSAQVTIGNLSATTLSVGTCITNFTVSLANANLISNATSGNAFVLIQGLAGTIRGIAFRTGTLSTGDRWRFQVDGTAEGGSNAGSNFSLSSFSDTGVAVSTPLSIARSTGVITIGGGGIIGSGATGGAKGVGTANFVAVYDDNVLLTCYVIEAATTGQIDLARWDALNHGKPHAPARKFAHRTEVLDVDKYIAEWKETGVLPGMPDPEAWADAGGMAVGDMVQRLWETVELLAVHIDQINTKVGVARA